MHRLSGKLFCNDNKNNSQNAYNFIIPYCYYEGNYGIAGVHLCETEKRNTCPPRSRVRHMACLMRWIPF